MEKDNADKIRYLKVFDCCFDEKIPFDFNETVEGRLAKIIINVMNSKERSFVDSCVMLGYMSKLLNLNDSFRGKTDREEKYIKNCLRKELIELSKDIVKYIEFQSEFYADINITFSIIYNLLKFESDNNIQI